MMTASTLSTKLSEREQNEINARYHLKRFISNAVGHGFLEEKESKTEEGDENKSILEKLKKIQENTKKGSTPFELIFHVALNSIDFAEHIIDINATLKSNYEMLMLMEAERSTCNSIVQFLKQFAVPEKLISTEHIPETKRENVIAALKILQKTINEKNPPETKELKNPSITITSLMQEALNKIDFTTEKALELSNIALQTISSKEVSDKIALQTIENTIKKYKNHVKQSVILWNTSEVSVYLQIENLLQNKNLSANKKLSIINEKIRPVIKEFLDENHVIDQDKLLEGKEITTKKVLAAIYFALEGTPCLHVEEKINTALFPEDIDTYFKMEKSPRLIML